MGLLQTKQARSARVQEASGTPTAILEPGEYAELSDGLTLTRHPVSQGQAETVSILDETNHVLVIDRSGSMSWTIREVIRKAKELLNLYKPGDTFTGAWFSSEDGQYSIFLKGVRLERENVPQIERLLDSMASTVAMTCFSEVLTALADTILDIEIMTGIRRTSLVFLTDGHPVVRNVRSEQSRTLAALDRLQPHVPTSLFIGYGDYYNKPFMAEMAQHLGGALVHADDVETFGLHYAVHLKSQGDIQPAVPVQLERPDQVELAYVIQAGKPVALPVEPDGTTKVPLGKETALYVLRQGSQGSQGTPNHGASKVNLTEVAISQGDLGHSGLVQGLYAGAYLLSQRTRNDQALTLLAGLGEVAMIRDTVNAFQNAEYGQVEANILAAIQQPSARLLEGYNPNFLPARDAWCLVDTVDLLMGDPQATWIVRPDFGASYKTIGRKSVGPDDAPKVETLEARQPLYDDGSGGPLVWNSSRLNLSIRVQIPVRVTFRDEGYKQHGLGPQRDTSKFRTYTWVKDGLLNQDEVLIAMSHSTYLVLSEQGMIDEGYDPQNGNVVHLDRVPVINRAIADGATSGTQMARDAWEVLRQQARYRVWRYYEDLWFPREESKGEALQAALGEEAARYLLSHYITDKGYQPPTTTAPATDEYEALTFEIKVKGFSSLPKVEDVRLRMGELAKDPSGKPMTPSQRLVADAIEEFDRTGIYSMSKNVQKAMLQDNIRSIKQHMAAARQAVQRAKFGVILAKRWPDELPSRDDKTLVVDGQTFTFALGTERVKY